MEPFEGWLRLSTIMFKDKRRYPPMGERELHGEIDSDGNVRINESDL